jgi:hypothetical protein|tara:strand:- start:1463 stop:1630 length:168 start_codon:yes stop_codon:yes gene_type:complete
MPIWEMTVEKDGFTSFTKGKGERVYLTVDERQAVRVEEAICANGELAAEGGWATF